ncbi:MAG: radical SAM protein [Planctomycetes bacterium]|nr:radical SAM protein [Planctomycetota bacterium]
MDTIEAKSLFSPATGYIQRGGFQWTCNPYVGCTFGCKYCYAMYLPQNDQPKEDWGRWFRVKRNAVELAERHGRKVAGQAIYMSSVTDPYQPVERSLFLTRGILEALIPHQPRLVVQTRGPLVVRDIDLLNEFRSVRVNFSIPTDSESVRQAFEPKAPPLEKRWEAVATLRDAGIPFGICVTPTLPLEHPRKFAETLAASGAKVLVVQDFHHSGGGFGADTSKEAMSLVESLGWSTARYREFKNQLAGLTELFEGEAGFFPPPDSATAR